MKLRTRLTLLFSLAFSTLIILLNVFIYSSFSQMRKDEFYLRLQEKSENTLRLLADADDIDHELLRIIDQNTVNALYQEKTLIFDGNKRLIYSSLDNHPVNYSDALLDEVKEKGEVYITDEVTHSEVLGTFSTFGSTSFIVISSAYDRYGMEKLDEMRNTLLLASSVGVVIAVMIGYWLILKGFRPLETLSQNIKSITEQNLNIQVPVHTKAKDEFSELAMSYNQMLSRLSEAFDRQKTFVQHASHELRTPISAMMSEVEVAMEKEDEKSDHYKTLFVIRGSLDKLSDLINSLLLLSKVQDVTENKFREERIDEIVFAAAESVAEDFPSFKPVVEFSGTELSETALEIPAHRYLLKILFSNLMENGYKYSDDGRVIIRIRVEAETLTVEFINTGKTITHADQKNLFTPFFRSANSAGKPGYGLGLSVSKRVALYHGAEIKYTIEDGKNVFTVIFPTKKDKKESAPDLSLP